MDLIARSLLSIIFVCLFMLFIYFIIGILWDDGIAERLDALSNKAIELLSSDRSKVKADRI